MSLASLCNQRVSIESCLSQDAYGNPIYGSAVEYWARVVAQNRVVRSVRGEEVVSNVTVYVNSTSTFSVNDRITLPSGYSPQCPQIIRVSKPRGESSPHHTAIYC
jgi:hypothetical protein